MNPIFRKTGGLHTIRQLSNQSVTDKQTGTSGRGRSSVCNYISSLIQHLLLTKSLQHSLSCPYALASVPTLPLSRKSWHRPFSEGSSTKNNG